MQIHVVDTNKIPSYADEYIAARIRARRLSAGLPQEELAKKLGVTVQQVQRYEEGTNRVGVGRLVDIAQVLGVKVDWFFADLKADG